MRELSVSRANANMLAGSNNSGLSPGDGVVDMMQQVAAMLQSCSDRGLNATVRVSMLELRGRKTSDLLSSSLNSPNISIRDSDTSKHPYISGAEEISVASSAEMLDCLNLGLSRLSAPRVQGSPSATATNSAAAEAGSSGSLARADSREHSQHSTPCRHPDSHLIFTFSVLLQGARSAMPAPCNSQGKPPQPPPAPKPAFSTQPVPPLGTATSRVEPPASISSPAQEEYMARATIRIVDLNMPPSTSVESVSPSGDHHIPPSNEPGCEDATATTQPQSIPAASPVQRLASCSGSLENALSPGTIPHLSTVQSPRSPSAVVDGTHHLSLQTSSRRLQSRLPTPSKVTSIASGGEPRADVLQAAQVAGLVPSPQLTHACSGDGLSGFEALERALDSSTHGSAVMRYK